MCVCVYVCMRACVSLCVLVLCVDVCMSVNVLLTLKLQYMVGINYRGGLNMFII